MSSSLKRTLLEEQLLSQREHCSKSNFSLKENIARRATSRDAFGIENRKLLSGLGFYNQ